MAKEKATRRQHDDSMSLNAHSRKAWQHAILDGYFDDEPDDFSDSRIEESIKEYLGCLEF